MQYAMHHGLWNRGIGTIGCTARNGPATLERPGPWHLTYKEVDATWSLDGYASWRLVGLGAVSAVPDGCAVIKYRGKRGDVWRIKYRDASRVQIMETLGKASDGWTKRKAQAELRARLTMVEKEGFKRPAAKTFSAFAESWLTTYPEVHGLKRSTIRSYTGIVNQHLVTRFGHMKLSNIGVEQVDAFVAAKLRDGLSPATVNRSLNVLSLILGAALKRGLLNTNVVALTTRPKELRRKWRILTPAETVRTEKALDALIAEAENDRDREDRRTARAMFVVLMGTGIRAGEALGLHWRSVKLADPAGPTVRVEETYVRSAADTPKSQAGYRTIALGSRLAGELFDHRCRSAFDGDDDRVFANPRTGRPFGPSRYATILRQALAQAGILDYVRPSHDLRHSSITNGAAAGTSPAALMARAGHSSMTTTLRYIDLAGENFRDEADLLEKRLWGEVSATGAETT